MPRVQINPNDWEKYMLPVLENPDISSTIFYKTEVIGNDLFIHIRTFLNGFEVCTRVLWSDVKHKYQQAEVTLNDTGEMPNTLPDSAFDRFIHDMMNGRGIPEL